MERDPIAIIGIGCRYPRIHGPDQFWDLLRDGVDAVGEVPSDRFDIESLYDPRPGTPGKVVTKAGAFIDRINDFDAPFFGISPREAARMDPQQRILLETVWEAIEDGAEVPEKLDGTRGGVFIGFNYLDFSYLLMSGDPANVDMHASSGAAASVMAGRVSYSLNLRGPSVAVDTACSASLVAVHLACRSLWNGESDFCLAGGVNLVLHGGWSLAFSRASMLSPEGRCKFGDAGANGFVRGEGAGVVMLKPLSAALADGNPVYAVIRGTAVTNDGRASGYLMTPGEDGQAAAIAGAYEDAGISPSDVQYVEAHGTGTSVGDPVELRALSSVIAEGRQDGQTCYVGSVKSNFGHTEAAAGIAGLIKTSLALQHRAIPKSLHFNEPNPDIPWSSLPVTIPTELTPWPDLGRPAIAGVSSFGISGTNAHVVLEEAPPAAARTNSSPSSQLLVLSAQTPDALAEMATRVETFLDDGNTSVNLDDLCYTAAVRRTRHPQRLALVAHSTDEAREGLAAFIAGEGRIGLSVGNTGENKTRKIVFIFPGQGSQWLGMGKQLLESEPAFRQEIETCDAAMRQWVDWSLIEQLTADEEHSRLNDIGVIQPCLFAIEVALAALWRSWGIEPDAVIGHSMGEVAAAYVAGILSIEDATRIICRRSQLLRRVSGKGAMAVVDLSLEQAEQMISGYEDRISVAVSNSPTSTVLSGDPDAINQILEEVERDGIFCRPVKVDVASHSPQMDPLHDDLLEALDGVRPRGGAVAMASTVTTSYTTGLDMDAAYWIKNLRHPVLFAATVQKLLDDGHSVFVEMSPNPILTGAVQQTCRYLGREGIALPSLKRDEDERAAMLGSLGQLYVSGVSAAWERVTHGGRAIRMPTYPFQHQYLTMFDEQTPSTPQRRVPRDGHPLLGLHRVVASQPGTYIWDVEPDARLFPYLRDHRVHDSMVFPAAAYLDLAQAAAVEIFGPGSHVLEHVTFERALFMQEEESTRLQLVLTTDGRGGATFQFFAEDRIAEGSSWILCSRGDILPHPGDANGSTPLPQSIADIKRQLQNAVEPDEHYRLAAVRGIQYGPTFRGITEMWRRDGEILGRVTLPEDLRLDAGRYQIHPALLDACLQVQFHEALVATSGGDGSEKGATYLPTGVARLRFYRRPETTMYLHATLDDPNVKPGDEIISGSMTLLDEEGNVVAEGRGFRMQSLERELGSSLSDSMYTMNWELAEPSDEVKEDPGFGTWLVLGAESDLGEDVSAQLSSRGRTVIQVTAGTEYRVVEPEAFELDPGNRDHVARLLADLTTQGTTLQGVMQLWGTDAGRVDDMRLSDVHRAEDTGTIPALHLMQALVGSGLTPMPRLALVTTGAYALSGEESASPVQAALHALGRVLFNEHPEITSLRLDLSPRPTESDVAQMVQMALTGAGDEIAFRGGAQYVHRLVPYERSGEAPARTRAISGDDPFRLVSTKPGLLDNLALQRTSRRSPDPGEVEVKVHASALNFRDVMSALGILSGYPDGLGPLGCEFAGTIVAVGDGVEDLAIGDDVVAVSFNTFSRYVTADARLAVRKPAHLSFEEAATIPIAFLTSYYSLDTLGHMSEGERVLIHAAAGGVGLAAVQLAQRVGAEVFATAGTPEKHELLRSFGVEHIMSSRTLEFADQIMEQTGGKGVDLVLNSLAGEFIPRSLSVLAPYGRFLEIGRKDIYQNSPIGLQPFQRNLSFMAVDLDKMFRERPDYMGRLFREVMDLLDAGELKPLPVTVFPVGEIQQAFRYMAQARHTGKVVVSMDAETVEVLDRRDTSLHPNATYLITGGLGGLGLTVAEWMVERGAQHLVLVGRRGASAEAEAVIERMRERGAEITVARVDMTDEQQVRDLIDSVPTTSPLRGIIHAAAILDDGILVQQSGERFHEVMAPKVDGAWNLHHATAGEDLDFFVLFSSAATVIGSPGQSNYVAANEILDALALHRHSHGLPALSINWGPWSEVGLAARPDRGGRMAERGMASISPEQGVEALEAMLKEDAAQIALMPMDWEQWRDFYPVAAASPILSRVMEDGAGEETSNQGMSRQVLASLPAGERIPGLQAYLSEQVAKVLGMQASRVDLNQPLVRMGLDSLMAVELRTRIEMDFRITVAVTKFLEGITLAELAQLILDESGEPASDSVSPAETSPRPPEPVAVAAGTEPAVDLEGLSDDEVTAMLSNLMDEQKANE